MVLFLFILHNIFGLFCVPDGSQKREASLKIRFLLVFTQVFFHTSVTFYS